MRMGGNLHRVSYGFECIWQEELLWLLLWKVYNQRDSASWLTVLYHGLNDVSISSSSQLTMASIPGLLGSERCLHWDRSRTRFFGRACSSRCCRLRVSVSICVLISRPRGIKKARISYMCISIFQWAQEGNRSAQLTVADFASIPWEARAKSNIIINFWMLYCPCHMILRLECLFRNWTRVFARSLHQLWPWLRKAQRELSHRIFRRLRQLPSTTSTR